MSDKNFAQIFCERFDVPAERFVEEALKRTLYSHARLLLIPLCACLRLRWLDCDREVLTDIGGMTDLEGVKRVLSRMPWYYGRGWKIRHEFRLRLSSRKLVNLVTRLGLATPRRASSRGVDSVRLLGPENEKSAPLREGAIRAA
jgi:hypothetical protein